MGTRGSPGSCPSNFETEGAALLNFDLNVFKSCCFFGIGIFKIKWPKSEEKLKFGSGYPSNSFLVAAPLPPNLKIVPKPLSFLVVYCDLK